MYQKGKVVYGKGSGVNGTAILSFCGMRTFSGIKLIPPEFREMLTGINAEF